MTCNLYNTLKFKLINELNSVNAISHDVILCVPTDPTEPIRSDLWRANIDCSVPDTISVLIEDLPRPSNSVGYTEDIWEVRIHCTNGNAQVGIIIIDL